MKYTKKLVNEARLVAVKAHSPQSYDAMFPYEKHLDDVVQILKDHGFSNRFLIAGYLHDVIEDGAVSFSKIRDYFGKPVAEMVFCVTDELGRNRQERKEKTYPKIRSNPDAIVIKLADRIANIEHGGKVGMYKKEHDHFKQWLKIPEHNDDEMIQELWRRLDQLLGG